MALPVLRNVPNATVLLPASTAPPLMPDCAPDHFHTSSADGKSAGTAVPVPVRLPLAAVLLLLRLHLVLRRLLLLLLLLLLLIGRRRSVARCVIDGGGDDV